MKSYFIDEIEPSGMAMINRYLASNTMESKVERLYWVEIPEELLNDAQSAHPACSPHRVALETGDSWIRAEFFVRTSRGLSCNCNGYCDQNQREYIIKYIDIMILELGVRT